MNKLSKLSVLLSLAIVPAYGMQRPKSEGYEEFMKFANWLGRGVETVGNSIGDGVKAIGNEAQHQLEEARKRARKREEAFLAQKAGLERDIDNIDRQLTSAHISDQTRAIYEDQKRKKSIELEKIQRHYDKAIENAERLSEGNIMKMGQDIMAGAADVVKENIRIANERQTEVAKEEQRAKFAAAEGIARAKVDASNNRKMWRDRMKFLGNRKNMITLGIGAAAIAGGAYGMKHGTALLAKMIEHYYRNPSLSSDTSLLTLQEKIQELVWGKRIVKADISDVILKPELQEQIETIAESFKVAVKNGYYLPNVMFYGPPGTGKTMVAKRIAYYSGAEYIYFAGSDLLKLANEKSVSEALIKISELFEFAKKSSKKLIIIMDEAEKIFPSRDGNISDQVGQILTHLLTYTGTESKDFMLVVMTNRPQDFDEAALSRLDYRVKIDKPELKERIGILKKYIKELILEVPTQLRQSTIWTRLHDRIYKPEPILELKVENEALSDLVIEAIANRIDGFVGRDIFKMVLAMQARASLSKDRTLTAQMIASVIDQKIKEHNAKLKKFEFVA